MIPADYRFDSKLDLFVHRETGATLTRAAMFEWNRQRIRAEVDARIAATPVKAMSAKREQRFADRRERMEALGK